MITEANIKTDMNDNLTNGVQLHPNLEELYSLCRNEIPEGRQTLLETQSNLEKVADYCATSYHDSDPKHKKDAFERTRNYTTHSLASVAYQINTLAYNILRMLDLQTNQISEMESQINFISQKVLFHKEKVARREIALLTSAKTVDRLPKVLVPANKEKQGKYSRKPIDFSILDDIGHGVKVQITQPIYHSSNNSSSRISGTQTLGPKSSISSMQHYYNFNTLGGSGPAPTTKPPTPPQGVRGYGTLTRLQNKEYRALAPPIAPPQVPKNYEPNYPIGHSKSQLTPRQNSINYSTLPNTQNHQSQYMPGMGHYGTNNATMSTGNLNINSMNQYGQSIGMIHPMSQSSMHIENNTSSLPPPLTGDVTTQLNESLPDPPPHFQQPNMMSHYGTRASANSPPLPPPPPPVDDHDTMIPMMRNTSIYGTSNRHDNIPEWAPQNYIEKVIAMYDYEADKDDELSFQENSVIYVISKNDDGWFEGVLNGLTGLFPGNYVEPCL